MNKEKKYELIGLDGSRILTVRGYKIESSMLRPGEHLIVDKDSTIICVVPPGVIISEVKDV